MAQISFELITWRGTSCACGKSGRIDPLTHDESCPWRKLAEADLAADQDERRLDD